MSNHTPGPWVTDTSHTEWDGITVWANDNVISHVVDDHHGNALANAALIAAAPDMLAALRDLIDACDYPELRKDVPLLGRAIDEAKAISASARGEEVLCDYHADSPGWDECSEGQPCAKRGEA